jgi:BASS family bile acid:Na+ symporter
VFTDKTPVTLPMLLLALLLFNAGLGIRLDALRGWGRNLGILLIGVAANVLIPILFLYLVSRLKFFWPNSANLEHLVMGLALIASMPVAGSSTAWAQNANGDMNLSLGLVLLSTFLSPLTTPMALHAAGGMATGEYAASLHRLAQIGTGTFLSLFVLFPSLAGLGMALAGVSRIGWFRPWLKTSNIVCLLLLNYSNAATSLPQLVSSHEVASLMAILLIASLLCGIAFLAAADIARMLGVSREQRVALMFGLGMNNNGTGLVLASSALPAHPAVMLPIIAYNLIQHVIAGGVYAVLRRQSPVDTG